MTSSPPQRGRPGLNSRVRTPRDIPTRSIRLHPRGGRLPGAPKYAGPVTANPDSASAPALPSARELNAHELDLVEAARAVIDANTDAGPNQDGIHTMGAAVLCSRGGIFTGVNLYHFTGGPCAELVALATARAQGGRDPLCIVAVGNHGRGVCNPCGRDRQVFVDHHPGIRVIVSTPAGVRSVLATDLVPVSYVSPEALA